MVHSLQKFLHPKAQGSDVKQAPEAWHFLAFILLLYLATVGKWQLPH
jgi:hypothetical protein